MLRNGPTGETRGRAPEGVAAPAQADLAPLWAEMCALADILPGILPKATFGSKNDPRRGQA
ncbi:hypothetical protein HOY34_10905 [Xinfangfangia sp. D13-10-4-6]|uniref:hypothetical protein n=1 Tax=Pseudogemmobacter hezensis TaxID=2737662 RepID=UPI0015545B26|nr:hypothetical protein [Pseudogemmobacter hezensis]NPD15711.1 hypothetical protein [Pseudogemmobacter hezensis]